MMTGVDASILAKQQIDHALAAARRRRVAIFAFLDQLRKRDPGIAIADGCAVAELTSLAAERSDRDGAEEGGFL